MLDLEYIEQNAYDHGYRRGFEAGRKKAREQFDEVLTEQLEEIRIALRRFGAECAKAVREAMNDIDEKSVTEMSDDLIKRSDAIEAIEVVDWYHQNRNKDMVSGANSDEHQAWYKADDIYKALKTVPTADRPQGEWIPCSERLPEDLEVVNITWINHRPTTYYADIKGKPFTATAIHYKDKWWWYSPICKDLLAECGKSECDKMDADIEVTAWMPLPKPWRGADDERGR